MGLSQIDIFLYIVIILSAVVHEYAHAWTADRLGDPTPRLSGRLTLNPVAHIELFGTVLLPLLLLWLQAPFIGWAKPVPFNPYNLRDARWGVFKVGLAGPAANIGMALILSLVFRWAPLGAVGLVDPMRLGLFMEFLAFIIYINISLGLFNLIPVPPLDGSKVFPELLPFRWRDALQQSFVGIILALIVAMYFLPIFSGALFRVFTGQYFR